jgi:hypothetical protein
VTIQFNRCGPVPCITGTTIDSQVGGFSSTNVTNVLVQFNRYSDIQNTDPVRLPSPHTCSKVPHGALYLQAAGTSGVSHHIDGVLYLNNSVTRTARWGIHVQETGTPQGVVTNIGYQGNRLSGIGNAPPIAIQAGGIAACVDNQIVDESMITAANCPTGSMPAVNGTTYTHL